MRRPALSLAAVLLVAATAAAQPPLRYRLSSPAPAAHLLQVELTVSPEYGCPELAMAAWTPGGYMLSFHAGKVVQARFTSPDGKTLAADKPDLSTWRVACDGGGYTARLTLYLSSPENPYSADVEAELVFANLVAVLPYLPAHQDSPAELRFDPPPAWHAVSSLPAREDGTLEAPDWDALADGIVAAAPELVTAGEDLDGARITIAFTRPPAEKVDLRKVRAAHRDLVRAAARTFGSLPFPSYLFLYKVGPAGSHGGLEHANGTAMGIPASELESTAALLGGMGLPAHELVHAWNVKRARPRQLRPYDYARVQRTDLLWVAEGWTSYYGPLLLVRAGVEEPEKLYASLTRRLRYHRGNPANRFLSLAQISLDSWLPRTAPYLSFRTYYVKGSLAALDLDMRLRRASKGRSSLDDLMQVLLQDPDLARTGYTLADLRFQAGRLAGRPLDGWFQQVALQPGYLDLAPALRQVGLRLEPDPKGPAAWTGLVLDDRAREPRGARVRWTEPGSPAALAGIGGGDLLLAVNGRLGSRSDLEAALNAAVPGETVHLTLLRGDRVVETAVTPVELDPLRRPVRVVEDPDAPEEAVAARRAWLWLDRD